MCFCNKVLLFSEHDAEGRNIGQHQNIIHVRGTVVQREQDQLIRLGAVDRAAVLAFTPKRFLPIVQI